MDMDMPHDCVHHVAGCHVNSKCDSKCRQRSSYAHCTAWAAFIIGRRGTEEGEGQQKLQQQQLIYLLALSTGNWQQQRMCGTLIFRSTAAATPFFPFLLNTLMNNYLQDADK